MSFCDKVGLPFFIVRIFILLRILYLIILIIFIKKKQIFPLERDIRCIFILLPFLLHLIPCGGEHEDRRTTNDEDNHYRYLYLLSWPYSASTENILRGVVQDPFKVPDEIFYQLILK